MGERSEQVERLERSCAPGHLGAVARRAARVLEGGSPVLRSIDHDLLLRVDMECRESEPLAARKKGFRAELGVDARARLQCKIQARGAAGAVSELRESRSLEASSDVAVEIQRGGD